MSWHGTGRPLTQDQPHHCRQQAWCWKEGTADPCLSEGCSLGIQTGLYSCDHQDPCTSLQPCDGVAAVAKVRHQALEACPDLVCKGSLRGICRDLLWSWTALGKGYRIARMPTLMPSLCKVGSSWLCRSHRAGQPGTQCHKISSLQRHGAMCLGFAEMV